MKDLFNAVLIRYVNLFNITTNTCSNLKQVIDVNLTYVYLHFYTFHSKTVNKKFYLSNNAENKLKNNFPMDIFNNILNSQQENSLRLEQVTYKKQQRKIVIVYFEELLTQSTNKDKNSWFKNLFSTDIPQNVIDIVSLGPKFSPLNSLNNNAIIEHIK